MLNHIVVMGRLVQDPELRSTPSGVNLSRFTIACERDFGSRENGDRQTDFIDCVAWRQTGEFISRFFQKGRMIVVSGRLQSRKWQDRDGNNRTSWEIQVDNAYFGDSKRDSDNQGNYGQSSYGNAGQSYGGSGNYGGYAAPRQNTSASPVNDGFAELDDDGDLPF